MTYLYYALIVVYLLVLGIICVYGGHRYALVYLYYKHRSGTPKLTSCFRQLPRVTIQLPMFNERLVARRVIERACAIDYPRDRLQIQVLDDSTDDTADIARLVVAELQTQGQPVELIHRQCREGYKAGALAEGLRRASGEFVCIFDADFIPTPNVLLDSIHYFTDPGVGMVQVRWSHVNRDQSLLTKAQAVFLDGHFVIEHGARNRSGRFMNFNGTAGVWRAQCIADAGGWHYDTLTEDMDLSYRAQLRGWKFLFLPHTEVPAELPPTMSAFKTQQHRWTKGGAQTCKKLLPEILKSPWPWAVKIEALFHLTSSVVYGCVVILSLLLYPIMVLKLNFFEGQPVARLMFDCSLLALATFSASSFYICSQRELNKSWWESLKYLPLMMSLGVGVALNNCRAALQGFWGKPSEFVRTPKYGVESGARPAVSPLRAYVPNTDFQWQPWLELTMGLYLLSVTLLCLVRDPISLGLPFLGLFAFGYLYVAIATLAESDRWQRVAPPTPPQPAQAI